ncbi:MAG: GNAT family N-acetyltransferase, partial [Candidatus Omnitrophota bacterium]
MYEIILSRYRKHILLKVLCLLLIIAFLVNDVSFAADEVRSCLAIPSFGKNGLKRAAEECMMRVIAEGMHQDLTADEMRSAIHEIMTGPAFERVAARFNLGRLRYEDRRFILPTRDGRHEYRFSATGYPDVQVIRLDSGKAVNVREVEIGRVERVTESVQDGYAFVRESVDGESIDLKVEAAPELRDELDTALNECRPCSIPMLIPKESVDIAHPDNEITDLREAIEVLNRWIVEKTPLTEERLKTLHGILAKTMAGVKVKGEYVSRPGRNVRAGMDELFRFIAAHEETMHPIELAAYVFRQVINIHPFEEGNGRASRLFMNYILCSHGYRPFVKTWETKEEYEEAFSRGHEKIALYLARNMKTLSGYMQALNGRDLVDVTDKAYQLEIVREKEGWPGTTVVVKDGDTEVAWLGLAIDDLNNTVEMRHHFVIPKYQRRDILNRLIIAAASVCPEYAMWELDAGQMPTGRGAMVTTMDSLALGKAGYKMQYEFAGDGRHMDWLVLRAWKTQWDWVPAMPRRNFGAFYRREFVICDRFVRALGIKKGDSVLNVGTDWGTFIQPGLAAAKYGADVTEIDTSFRAVAAAQRKAMARHPALYRRVRNNLVYEQGDLLDSEKYPADTQDFTLVFNLFDSWLGGSFFGLIPDSSEAELKAERMGLIRRALEVTKDSGTLVVSTVYPSEKYLAELDEAADVMGYALEPVPGITETPLGYLPHVKAYAYRVRKNADSEPGSVDAYLAKYDASDACAPQTWQTGQKIYDSKYKMPPGIVGKIRPAMLEDALAVRKLSDLIYQPGYRCSKRFFVQAIRKDNDWTAEYLWVCEQGGEIVGYILATLDKRHVSANVGQIAVAPARQNNGIGKALWAVMMRHMQALNVESFKVRASNKYTAHIAKEFGLTCENPDPDGTGWYAADFSDYPDKLSLDTLKAEIPRIDRALRSPDKSVVARMKEVIQRDLGQYFKKIDPRVIGIREFDALGSAFYVSADKEVFAYSPFVHLSAGDMCGVINKQIR